tara:strand:- start:41963 stop:42229 length:267 start_codon:yes stop_codon:yes gene_type:complete
MKIAVWDTYVKRSDGIIMHFDILVDSTLQDAEKVFRYGQAYLDTKSFETEKLTSKECIFCHVERPTEALTTEIETNGFSIIEMENCDE